jgi:hypothetical protein
MVSKTYVKISWDYPFKVKNFFFIEYGYDGYQKNLLSMQISKKLSYLSDKMHLEKVTGKNVKT